MDFQLDTLALYNKILFTKVHMDMALLKQVLLVRCICSLSGLVLCTIMMILSSNFYWCEEQDSDQNLKFQLGDKLVLLLTLNCIYQTCILGKEVICFHCSNLKDARPIVCEIQM